ncbi:uncharacterized protein LOC109796460 [Cajanus cajan]|uniref:uncharacterized protein LOC109796460 n=1 Tax=Cajanus cajan TaxID=3821 RepID=UPI00098DA41E|nr:uncharacterized protein LOC109796460 [Cajanus cajan]
MERIWGMPMGSQPLSEPPNGGIGSLKMNQTMTFKEKVLGTPATRPTVRDLIKEGAMTLEFEGGDRLLPKFSITAPTLKQLCEPWEQCLVIKLLGREVGFLTLRDRLSALWKVQGGFELLDVSNGYFMVKFDLEADRDRVMHGGPWMLFDHYLIVRPWSPEFVASATKVDSTLVWIRFPGLGVMFYDESVLLTIASAIGKPVKVDLNTLNMTRGRFTRVCVEINLEEPVVGRFFLNGVWYNVEYEGLHLLCSSCGCYGHVLRNCPHAIRPESKVTAMGEKENTVQLPRDPPHGEGSVAPTGEQSALRVRGELAPEPHGDWLIVKRRNRKSNLGKPLNKGRSSSHNGSEIITEQHHNVPSYSKRGVHNLAETRLGFKSTHTVRESPREQGHALGSLAPDGGHGVLINENRMGPTLDRKKRSRGGESNAQPRPIPANAAASAASSALKDRSTHTSPYLGDSRLVQEGMQGTTSSVLHTGCTTNVHNDSEDTIQEIPGVEDIMQYDQPLETMMA